MKKPDSAIVPFQSRMFEHGVRIKDVCKTAGVSPSTWSRWAAGGVPDLGTLRKMEAALEEEIAKGQ
jgi:hypothetical protein